MREIKSVPHDDPDHDYLLHKADTVVDIANRWQYPLNVADQETILLAYATLKEHIKYHNDAWRTEGYDGMVRPDIPGW